MTVDTLMLFFNTKREFKTLKIEKIDLTKPYTEGTGDSFIEFYELDKFPGFTAYLISYFASLPDWLDTLNFNPVIEYAKKKYNVNFEFTNSEGFLKEPSLEDLISSLRLTSKTIKRILSFFNVKKIYIHSNLEVDVLQSITLSNIKGLKNFPIKFNEIHGDFNIINCEFTSLEDWAPKKVLGSWKCFKNNKLKSLKGGPIFVGQNFICSSNFNLETLKYSPKVVEGHVNCRDSNFKSVEGITLRTRRYFLDSKFKSIEASFLKRKHPQL